MLGTLPAKRIIPKPMNFKRAKSVLDSFIDKKDARMPDLNQKQSTFDKRAIKMGLNLLA